MALWEAALLGLVQGLAEFLPISSSGHLALAQYFLGLPNLEELLPFDVLLHVATLLAVIAFFRNELARVVTAGLRSARTTLRRGGWTGLAENPDAKWFWLLLLTMIPTGMVVIGLRPVSDFVDAHIITVPLLLLVAGAFNWYSHHRAQRNGEGRRIEAMSAGDALVCGAAQGLAAVFHGMSRSGSTIAAGLWCGLSREDAPRFSFLMLIPSVTAAALMEVPKLAASEAVGGGAMVIGFLVALVSGYVAVGLTMKVVSRDRLRWLAGYCWVLGLVALVAILLLPQPSAALALIVPR